VHYTQPALNLIQLQAELAAAGVVVPALGTNGPAVFTYNPDGSFLELPPAAAPVVAAHTPAPIVRPLLALDTSFQTLVTDIQTLDTTIQGAANLADVKAALHQMAVLIKQMAGFLHQQAVLIRTDVHEG
jgi:hypothetical protein